MAAANESEERRAQKSYWMEHSKDLSVEAMMLDSRASDLDKEERPEVLSLLPPYQGKYVLELGAGIGRFTGELAKEAGHILALDFIESVIKKNERINGHFQNTSFLCADVTSPELAFEEGSVDLLFSNWLLMYLSDDEIIKRANEKGEDPLSLSKRFSEEFLYDMAELNCLPPTHEPRVSDHIEHIKDMITKILENGHAYTIEGDVYFSVDTYPDYYCLSGRKSDDNRAGGGGRVAVDTRKRNPADFALWKAAKLGEPSWESPWGPGRPGWHIECSAMSAHHLGDCFDIHGGGKDLMFPHHENEIAQSSSACPQSKVNYWMHNGFVNRDNQKMSKSDNNFFTIRDIITIYHPLALRFFLLRTHYRSDVNYSDKALDTASDRVFYMYQTLHECEIALSPIRSENFKGQVPADVKEQIEKFHTEYLSSMSDDLHTTTALDDLIDLLKSINGTLKKFKGKKQQQPLILSLLALKKEVKDFLGALGLLSLSTVAEVLQQLKDKALKRAGFTEEEVQRKIEERNLARKNKEYEKSDLIREELYLKGISLMDEPKGTIWRPCEPPEKKSEENIDTHIDKPIS